jgi:membrane fusion protein (multidrug efflux system)
MDGLMSRAHSSFVFAAVLALGAVLAVGCGQSSAARTRTRPPPLVSVAKIKVRDVPIEARAPVDLKPLAMADIGSKVMGYLDAVLVDRGDKVKRGQVLALVRPSDLPDQLAALRGNLSQVQANLALSRANAARAKGLAPSGVVSQQELENTASAVSAGEANETALKAQISAIAVRLGETRITSPMDGYVWRRLLDPGALIGLTGGGGTILTVVQVDVVRVFINVGERDTPGLHLGLPAYFETDAYPGRRFEGKVVRLSPAFDPVTRTLEAEVRIPNPTGELRPGMYGRGAIVLAVHRNAVTVPATAIQISNEQKYVFVLEGGDIARRRDIQTGFDHGAWLEVTKGLESAGEIVTAGADGLSDNTRVRPVRDVDPYSGERVADETPAGQLPGDKP